MFRRLAKLALVFSLVTTAAAPALAGFAQPPPGADAPAASLSIDAGARDEAPEIHTLSASARARLRKVLAQRRAKNVQSFAGYVARGVFPHNFVEPGALNVWIDEEGHMCAAATMIFRSGTKQRALVRAVGARDNYIRLADVTEGPLLDWILTSGLTHAEVVAIQEPFMGRPGELDPRRMPVDWRVAEDDRLRARYAVVKQQLAADRADSLEAAIDALAARPDLVARLI